MAKPPHKQDVTRVESNRFDTRISSSPRLVTIPWLKEGELFDSDLCQVVCNIRLRFELGSPCKFPTTVTIIPRNV